MTDLHTLISTVQAHTTSENKIRFGGKNRLQVERSKIELFKIDTYVQGWDWYYGVRNDFCVFIDVLDPYAAYVFVKLDEDQLKRMLVVSDGVDFREHQELPPLEMSLDDNEIARQLIETVVAATVPQQPAAKTHHK